VARLLVIAGVLLWAGGARAEPDLLSPQAFSGLVDLRISAADGERSWLNGGFGKTDLSGGGGSHIAGQARIEEADLAWKPQLAWNLSAVIEAELQPGHERGPRLGQAFLLYKPTPRTETRYQVRIGMFYPPISLENGGAFWTTTETITPSAINSWVGEEVKVVGAEVSARRSFGDQELGVTGGVFGFDDTAGELLATRGWSFDGVRGSLDGGYRLPPLSAFLASEQSAREAPVSEIDHRFGGYARLDWRANDRLALNALAYDNNGDMVSERDMQYAWRTHFVELGARLDLDDRTEILGQAMTGRTSIGPNTEPWVDTGFSAAYLLVSRKLGVDAITGRFDVFETRDYVDDYYGYTQEHGWALTADYRRPLSKHATFLIEALYVRSERQARKDILGQASAQAQTVAQAALRLSF
jgi:hypothetical protein